MRAGFAQARVVMPRAPEQRVLYGFWMLAATR